jgi:hypothetical protein
MRSSSPTSCYMARPSHPPRLDYSNYTWRRIKITKLLIMNSGVSISVYSQWKKKSPGGRAIIQAVTYFSTRRLGFYPRSDHVRFMMEKVALRRLSPLDSLPLASSHSTNCFRAGTIRPLLPCRVHSVPPSHMKKTKVPHA